MKGKTYLKVTGILMIIGGSIGIIVGVVALLGATALAKLLETSAAGLIFGCILVLVSAIVQLIAGITGVKNCSRPEKAKTCIKLGVAVALLSLAGNIISVAAGNSFSFTNLITGLALPVLYIVGAVLNKKSLEHS